MKERHIYVLSSTNWRHNHLHGDYCTGEQSKPLSFTIFTWFPETWAHKCLVL